MKTTTTEPDNQSPAVQIKSRQRIIEHGEVFTNEREVKAMCNLVKEETYRTDSLILEPACGNGNFLAEILERKLTVVTDQNRNKPEIWGHNALIALSSLYGIDIQSDNVVECRERLYGIWKGKYRDITDKDVPQCMKDTAFAVLEANIVCGDFLSMTKEDGDYIKLAAWNFSGNGNKPRRRDIYLYELIKTTDDGQRLLFSMDENEKAGFDFDVIIGNPPYQEDDGGAQASARPIYQLFIKTSRNLAPRFLIMITPSRWFTGGKNLDDFRNDFIRDDRISEIHDFPCASECFSGVEIKGGVNYFLWKKDHHGECTVSTYRDGKVISRMKRPLLEPGLDFFIRCNEAVAIVRKVMAFGEPSFANKVHPAMFFGLRTYFTDFDSAEPGDGLVKLYANQSQGYVKKSRIPRNAGFIDFWKVIVPEATGTGDTETDRLKPLISEPGSANTETYIMIGPWKDRKEVGNVISYIGTKFFHFLLGLKKLTQHTTAGTYSLIPLQDFSKPWTDAELYLKYGLTAEEVRFIDRAVWTENKDGGRK